MTKAHWSSQIPKGIRVRVYKYVTSKVAFYEGVVHGYVHRQNHLRAEILVDCRVNRDVIIPMVPQVMSFFANGTPIEGSNHVINQIDPLDHFEAWQTWYDNRQKKVVNWHGREIVATNPDDRFWSPDGYVLLKDPRINYE